MCQSLTWIDRARLSALLTEELRKVVGCQGATIIVGPSRDAKPGESNWFEFTCLVLQQADPPFVRAIAGGVVSEARERYNVLDSRPRRNAGGVNRRIFRSLSGGGPAFAVRASVSQS